VNKSLKKVFRYTGWIGITIIFIVFCIWAYIKFLLPSVGAAPDIKLERTAKRLERGSYLANHVMHCTYCHGQMGRPDSSFEGIGSGGLKEDWPVASFYLPNITPVGVGNWSDGELYRAITCGVNNKGKAMIPTMPYVYFGRIDPEDIKSVIVYIRSLSPAGKKWPEHRIKFPFDLLLNMIPVRSNPEPIPDTLKKVAYGKYMVNAGGCIGCHTPAVNGKPIDSLIFSGGTEFTLPNIIVRSANITPDERTGIFNWTEQYFIQRFKMYDTIPEKQVNLMHPSIMPWKNFSGMTTGDLGAIYQYLRTVKSIHHEVEKYSKNK
jgi:mono/diheme cytochrome c family protein